MSIEELMAASQQVYSESNSSSGEEKRRRKHPSGHADTSLQMKLENITRMMESSPSLSSPVSSSMVRPIFSGKILCTNSPCTLRTELRKKMKKNWENMRENTGEWGKNLVVSFLPTWGWESGYAPDSATNTSVQNFWFLQSMREWYRGKHVLSNILYASIKWRDVNPWSWDISVLLWGTTLMAGSDWCIAVRRDIRFTLNFIKMIDPHGLFGVSQVDWLCPTVTMDVLETSREDTSDTVLSILNFSYTRCRNETPLWISVKSFDTSIS